jgi:hypothetical protein
VKSNAGAKAHCLAEIAELTDLLRDIQASTHLQQNWKVDHARGVEAVEPYINSPTSVLRHYLRRKKNLGCGNYSS